MIFEAKSVRKKIPESSEWHSHADVDIKYFPDYEVIYFGDDIMISDINSVFAALGSLMDEPDSELCTVAVDGMAINEDAVFNIQIEKTTFQGNQGCILKIYENDDQMPAQIVFVNAEDIEELLQEQARYL